MKPPQGNADYAKVGLVVKSDTLDALAITRATQLAPTWAWKKGHKHVTRLGQEFEKANGLWALECESVTVADAALELLAKVEPRMAEIRAVALDANAEVGVTIWWEPEGRQGGFDLDSSVLRRLSDLGPRVFLYFPGCHDKEGSSSSS